MRVIRIPEIDVIAEVRTIPEAERTLGHERVRGFQGAVC